MSAMLEKSIKPIEVGIKPVSYVAIQPGGAMAVDSEVVEEAHACITVNGQEIAQFMCSPRQLDQLALGFLYNEAIIQTSADIRSLHISNSNCIDVWLNYEFEAPKTKIVTAGCGGGVTFDDLSQQHPALKSDLTITAEDLAEKMKTVLSGAELYRKARGIHTAALADGQRITYQVEDIGRHNCIDKLAGVVLQDDYDPQDHILFSSGRISSEMLNKARRMGIPIVCSRTSPTSLSVELAHEWGITLVGYLRQNRMRLYAHPERVTNAGEPTL